LRSFPLRGGAMVGLRHVWRGAGGLCNCGPRAGGRGWGNCAALRRIALIYPQSHPAMCWPRMKPFYSVARRQLTQVLRAKSALRRSTIFDNKGSTNDYTLGHIEPDADRAAQGVI